MSLRDAYPVDASADTRRFIRYWFDNRNRRELAALSQAIRGVRADDVRQVLWCAFSRLIIAKQASASRAMDIAHSRPHLVLNREPIRPYECFLSAVERVLCARDEVQYAGPTPSLSQGDARELPLESETIDLAITSPPYLNAIDYLRGHKFTLVWMGHDVGKIRGLRAGNIGTEVSAGASPDDKNVATVLRRMRREKSLPRREWMMFARYLNDMDAVLSELHRVLVPGGHAILVLGNNTVRGVFVRNAHAIGLLGELVGFQEYERTRRLLPPNRRYLPPPVTGAGEQLEARMREEVVLTLAKR
ncbi:MAG: hypothetical protein WBB01_02870 [Phormidesmis sp.]